MDQFQGAKFASETGETFFIQKGKRAVEESHAFQHQEDFGS